MIISDLHENRREFLLCGTCVSCTFTMLVICDDKRRPINVVGRVLSFITKVTVINLEFALTFRDWPDGICQKNVWLGSNLRRLLASCKCTERAKYSWGNDG